LIIFIKLNLKQKYLTTKMNRLANLNNQFEAQETSNFGNQEFKHVKQAPADPILSLSAGYKSEKFAKKVNLGIGAYRSEDGKPYVFPVVRAAEEKIVAKKLEKEYLPITGVEEFCKGSRGVLFGWDHKDVNSGRVASAQTLSGTGALRVISDFLVQFKPSCIYVSTPTWGNHNSVFATSGLEVRPYRYFHKKTKGLDFEGMLADLNDATQGSVVLLHTCAHNPTGVDPTLDQWKQIAEVCRARSLYPFFDTAY
jgi:aspartate aminotransferase